MQSTCPTATNNPALLVPVSCCVSRLCAAPALQYLSHVPSGPTHLLEEIKNNTHHYISVIADAADSQLAMLTTTGSVPADVYDNLQETVRRCGGGGGGGVIQHMHFLVDSFP